MTYRKTIETSTHVDDIIGGRKTFYSRALQPVNKDGRDSKRRARLTGAYLVVYPDGGYRYYGPTQVYVSGLRGTMTSIGLRRERITDAYHEAEVSAPDFDQDWYFAD